ncbi:alpha/beta fold hydrolase [Sphingomonas sp.]|uniref:alpha/beta hydrolase n=1 Tax=Sphingomonas sp. TaxID=28214 RepID=UPI000DB1010C|nr:alpha/beta fold hydrolase [Sphingomonas sp.]PZU09276.1 MAG: alpha/beta hydrolase [Sphingomonas sp.]
MFKAAVPALALLGASPLAASLPPAAIVFDPTPDPAAPASMKAFVLPSHGSGLNAVFYKASGAGPHPTLLLLHGFPGNEQNLDLAQAARRAGWHVLTLHYRGSWGSRGDFSFHHCAEDAQAALAWLRAQGAAGGIATSRIVVAGHSMGGMMAAFAAARDPDVMGTVLIDPWDIAATGRSFADPAAKKEFIEGELRGDLPPLAGTSEAALVTEIETAGADLDLAETAKNIGKRPLLVIGAERALAPTARTVAAAAGPAARLVVMPTDHSFSDHRIALANALLGFLQDRR